MIARHTTYVLAAAALYVASLAQAGLGAQGSGSTRTVLPTSLKKLAVPEPPNLADFVRNRTAAIALGKALFWDMQSSSDNLLACASCHFHAGADNRVKNSINPDLNHSSGAPLSTKFDPVATGNKGGANYTLTGADFPFHQLVDPTDRDSAVLFDSNDVVSSAGVNNSEFGRLLTLLERNRYAPDGVFQVGGVATRRVEPRNTPTTINAVLNYRSFWDGRANSVFNGVTPFGARDQTARVWLDDPYVNASGTSVQRAIAVAVRIPFASAASQAVGPPLSAFEMSASGRVWADLGRKLLKSRPLLYQQVSATDSVLGSLRTSAGFGLTSTYESLIRQAFWPDYWQTPDASFKLSSASTYRQIEMNFSLFWGIAIQMYEATLISDDSRFDRFAGGDRTALTAQEQQGLAIFSSDRGRCVNCHKGAEFTGASTRLILGSGPGSVGGDGPLEHMLMGDSQEAVYDNGFYNIGVVPAANDAGVGGRDPFGNPLSFARQFRAEREGKPAADGYGVSLDPCVFQSVEGCTIVQTASREAVDGSFKTPSLRNVELTGPYFHTGGYATLEQVVDFYSRGGNVRTTVSGDSSGLGVHGSNLDLDIRPLGLTKAEKAALVAFLRALTDDRVRWEKAPFDHPSLVIPNGAAGNNGSVRVLFGKAADELMRIPAVGAGGLGALKLPPVQPFAPK